MENGENQGKQFFRNVENKVYIYKLFEICVKFLLNQNFAWFVIIVLHIIFRNQLLCSKYAENEKN